MFKVAFRQKKRLKKNVPIHTTLPYLKKKKNFDHLKKKIRINIFQYQNYSYPGLIKKYEDMGITHDSGAREIIVTSLIHF